MLLVICVQGSNWFPWSWWLTKVKAGDNWLGVSSAHPIAETGTPSLQAWTAPCPLGTFESKNRSNGCWSRFEFLFLGAKLIEEVLGLGFWKVVQNGTTQGVVPGSFCPTVSMPGYVRFVWWNWRTHISTPTNGPPTGKFLEDSKWLLYRVCIACLLCTVYPETLHQSGMTWQPCRYRTPWKGMKYTQLENFSARVGTGSS